MSGQAIHIERRGDYAILSLRREPVNSFNTGLWQDFKTAFDSLEADESVKAVVFRSGLSRSVFTAGNDINELYAPRTSPEQYRRFWVLSNHVLAQVYVSRLVTVCAIKGACPAGGCCLALCCDFRVMTGQGHIGLNEVALGIPVPLFWGRLMAMVVGNRVAEQLCKSAALIAPQEALRVGLIDEVVKDEDALLPAAERFLKQASKFPAYGRQQTKSQFRAELAQEWKSYAEKEPDSAWQMLTSPSVEEPLGAYLKQLQSKRSKL